MDFFFNQVPIIYLIAFPESSLVHYREVDNLLKSPIYFLTCPFNRAIYIELYIELHFCPKHCNLRIVSSSIPPSDFMLHYCFPHVALNEATYPSMFSIRCLSSLCRAINRMLNVVENYKAVRECAHSIPASRILVLKVQGQIFLKYYIWEICSLCRCKVETLISKFKFICVELVTINGSGTKRDYD